MLKLVSRSTIITLGLLATLSLSAFSAERPPADYVDPVTGMEFMAIPGGTFMMGDDQDSTARPAHEVTVKPFLLGRYEVTYEQYAKFCTSTGRLIPSDKGWGMGKRPVVEVTWHEAVEFTKWLSEQTGKKFRLPSESEWEYAARAGVRTKYQWGDEVGNNRANCDGCGSQWDGHMTAPAGSFAPNGFGLYDMVGNVYEWCLDVQHNIYEGAPADGSAWLDGGLQELRINRGGSWYRPPVESELSTRCWDTLDRERPDYGFRVAMEP